jgi:tRNA(Ile)-lysidine synthase
MNTMDLLQRFQHHVATNKLFKQGDELLVAVSGGVDSIVLTHLLYYSGYRIRLAHMNFGLREMRV